MIFGIKRVPYFHIPNNSNYDFPYLMRLIFLNDPSMSWFLFFTIFNNGEFCVWRESTYG
jgi:hypothetical protein